MDRSASNGLPVNYSAIVAAAHEAGRLQLTSERRGVISARYSESGFILITAEDVCLEDLRAEDICLVNPTGDIIKGTDDRSVPAELDLHLKVYQDRSDVNALVHLHPPHACKYAGRGELFAIPNREVQQQVGEFIRVICRECPSRFTGLCSCWTDIRQSASGAGALLLKEDGILALAEDLESAVRKAELIEQAARETFESTS